MARAGEDDDVSGRTSPGPPPNHRDSDHHHHHLEHPEIFTLRDTQQKVVCLRGNNLVAAAAAANVSPAAIKVMPNYVLQKQAGNPIFMGVGNRCLSCGTSEKPVLQLEDRDIQSVYNDTSKNLPFTFANLKMESTHQFESLAYPGWFLCTSQGNNEPLGITNQPGGKQITTFYFKTKG